MDRKEFLKSACGLGVCGCALSLVDPPETLAAAPRRRSRTSGSPSRAIRSPRWSASWPPDRRRRRARRSSRRPAGSAPSWANSASSSRVIPTRYFATARKAWGTDFSWDKEKGIITVAVAEGECSCPMVDSQRTPAFFCNCSVGYQKEAFEADLREAGPGVAQGVEARWQQAVRLRGYAVAGAGVNRRAARRGRQVDEMADTRRHPARAGLPAVLGSPGLPSPGLRGPGPRVDPPGTAGGPALAGARPDRGGRPDALGLSRPDGPLPQQAHPERAARRVALPGRASRRHGPGLRPLLAHPARHQLWSGDAACRGGTRRSSARSCRRPRICSAPSSTSPSSTS